LFQRIRRRTRVRRGGGLHPGAVRGEEQEHDEGDLLPHDLRHRHAERPVRLRRRHRRHHRQQPPRLRSVLGLEYQIKKVLHRE